MGFTLHASTRVDRGFLSLSLSFSAIAEFGAKRLRKRKRERAARGESARGLIADSEVIAATKERNERREKAEAKKTSEKKKTRKKREATHRVLAQTYPCAELIIFPCRLSDSCPVNSA